MSKRFKWQWAVITPPPPPPNRLSPPVPREIRMELEQSRIFSFDCKGLCNKVCNILQKMFCVMHYLYIFSECSFYKFI